MAYEFKKLSAVEAVETPADTANVLIEENGVIKRSRAPKKMSDLENDLFYVDKEVYTKTITLADCTRDYEGKYACVFPLPKGVPVTKAIAEPSAVVDGELITAKPETIQFYPIDDNVWTIQWYQSITGGRSIFCEVKNAIEGEEDEETGNIEYIIDGNAHFCASVWGSSKYHTIDDVDFEFTILETKKIAGPALDLPPHIADALVIKQDEVSGEWNVAHNEILKAVQSGKYPMVVEGNTVYSMSSCDSTTAIFVVMRFISYSKTCAMDTIVFSHDGTVNKNSFILN